MRDLYSNKTILHVITGLNDGGAEGVLYRLCTFDTRNRHVVISLSDMGKYGPKMLEEGVVVHCCGLRAGRSLPVGFFKLLHWIYHYNPDVVQTWLPHADLLGGIAARLVGVKSIFWGIRYTELEFGKSKLSTIVIVRLLARLSWWLPSGIAVCAQRAMDVHSDLGYDRSIMVLIPNGYDLTIFSPKRTEAAALRIEWSVDAPLIGTVGRYDPQKDHDNLLRALSLLRVRGVFFNCVMIGSNVVDRNKRLVSLIKELELGDLVKLLGPRTDIPVVMSALDLHVISSSSEAFPNVVAEAMACETPCVVTDVGDAAFIVGDTGWVVPPRDAEALANAIENALEEQQEDQWPQRCRSARDRIQRHFGMDRMVSAYHELWCGYHDR